MEQSLTEYSSRSWGKKKADNPFGKKSQQTPLTHVLNFKRYEPAPRTREPSSYRRPKTVVPFKKERFMQANYRFVVSPSGDYTRNLSTPDLSVDWDLIEQVCFTTNEESINCPICLDSLTAAKVGKCGHCFCWPCIIRHISYTSERVGKCPICFEFINLKDLKSVVVQSVHHYNDGDALQMTLLKRSRNSIVPMPSGRWRPKVEIYPMAMDKDTTFSRISIIEDVEPILSSDAKELQASLIEATSCQDDSIPFIVSAQTELKKRELDYEMSKKTHTNSREELERIVKKEPEVLEPTTATTTTSTKAQDSWEGAGLYENEETEEQIPQNEPPKETEEVEKSVSNSKNTTEPKKEANVEEESSDFYHFYQSNDGQQIFLHPLSMKLMLSQFGSPENFPEQITGKILEVEKYTMDHNLRKRWKFLGHLPLTSEFEFVELDLKHLISRDAVAPHLDEVKKRAKKRNQKKIQEKQEKRKEVRPKPNINPKEFPAVSKTFTQEELQMLALESQPPAVNEPMEFPSISAKEGSSSPAPVRQPPTTAAAPAPAASLSFADLLKPPPPIVISSSPFLNALKKKDQKQEKERELAPTPTAAATALPVKKTKTKGKSLYTNASSRNYKS